MVSTSPTINEFKNAPLSLSSMRTNETPSQIVRFSFKSTMSILIGPSVYRQNVPLPLPAMQWELTIATLHVRVIGFDVAPRTHLLFDCSTECQPQKVMEIRVQDFRLATKVKSLVLTEIHTIIKV